MWGYWKKDKCYTILKTVVIEIRFTTKVYTEVTNSEEENS